MVLLYLMEWMRTNTNHQFRLLTRGDGPLVNDFRRVTDTAVWQSNQQWGKGARLINRITGRTGAGVPREWQQYQWELIYSNTVTNGAVVNCVARPGVRVITHVHEMNTWIDRAGPENWAMVKNQTAHFIAGSDAVKDLLVSSYQIPSAKVDVVHEFVPAETITTRLDNLDRTTHQIRANLGIPPHAFIVGGCGHEYWRKGRDLFVQIASIINRVDVQREIHFLWVGPTGDVVDQRQLDYDAARAGVARYLHWVGEVADPIPYFAEFDVFAMVSREDPFPLVCLEAALLEKPIVCFASAGGVPELVENDAGYVVPYLDLATMVRRLLELLHDLPLRKSMGHRARAKVLERYSVGVAAPKITRIVEREIRYSRCRKSLTPEFLPDNC
jgi:glycosyltransferase involved in cell wall biosynthesis